MKRFSTSLMVLGLACCAVEAAPAQRRALRTPLAVASVPSGQADSSPVTPVAAALTELTALELRTRFGPYSARSAAWIPGQPIAVNRDFDFGVALGTEIGAGIAAAQRRDKNAALAKQLGQLEALDPQAMLRRVCTEQPAAPCEKLAAKPVRVYGLLYGERAARLRVVLELNDGGPASALYVSISEPAPVERFAEPGVLARSFAAELAHAVVLSARPAAQATTESGQCAAGDGTHVEGQIVERDATRVVLVSATPRPTLATCAMASFTQRGPQLIAPE